MRFARSSLTPLLLLASCLDATSIDLQVTVSIPCDAQRPGVVVVIGHSVTDLQAQLAQGAVAATKSGCTPDTPYSRVGDVVIVPSGARDETLALAVMTRLDGATPDDCGKLDLPQADRNQCIVARRVVSFSPHTTKTLPVNLAAACAGNLCAEDQTCLDGVCVSAIDLGATDAGSDSPLPGPDAGLCTAPTTLASNESPSTITTDGTTAYWFDMANMASASIRACAVAGCNGQPSDAVTGVAVSTSNDVVVVGGALYWIDGTFPGALWKCAGPSCTPTSLVNASQPQGLATDGTSLFWTENGSSQVRTCVAPSCSGLTVLAKNEQQPTRLVVDATTVYWIALTPGEIHACTKGGCGGQPQVLATALPLTFAGGSIAVDDVNVYWDAAPVSDAGTPGHVIQSCAKSGCASPSIVVGDLPRAPRDMRVVNGQIYWIDLQAVWACPVTGCAAPAQIIGNMTMGQRITLASGAAPCASTLLWTDEGSGNVWKSTL